MVRRLFDETRGCEKFAQRILSFGPGRSRERVDADADETLYVLDGSGTIALAGDEHRVEAGTSVFVGKGTPWAVDADDGVEVLSVLVFDPEPVAARRPRRGRPRARGAPQRDGVAAVHASVSIPRSAACR